ncbi:MAG: Gfo/Idh/MocA family oxidoreductase [Planctomycetota bacterium]|nr:Gfo/Idh/MocA family oxidoreductase [Planctomycetota bacterium]
MPGPLRIAIVGAGRWSREMHLKVLPRLAELEQVSFAGVCDLNAQAAAEYARALGGADTFTDLGAMIEAVRPDGVAVLVPPAAAAAVLEQVIARRVPFLTEKPPAHSAAAQRKLIAAAAGLTHVVAYNRRHCAYMQQAKEWLAGRALQAVQTHFSRYNRIEEDFTDTAVHGLDATRHLAGDDLAEARIEVAPGARARNFFITGWTKSGTRIEISITPDTASACEHYTVRSAARTVVLAFPMNGMIDLPGRVELHEDNRVVARKSAADFGIDPADQPVLAGILAEHRVFCQALRGQTQPFSTLASTLQTQEIRDAIYPLLARGGRASAEVALG